MEFKVLGQTAGTTNNQGVYQVPALNSAVCNISICNMQSTDATFRIAISTSTTPGDAEWINYDEVIPANSSFERTGIALQAAKMIVFRSSRTGISCSVWGSEKVV